MSHIQEEIYQIQKEIPTSTRLVAVSKFHPIEALQEAYDAGQRIFGESKVQEMTMKYEALPKDIEWHFIGHLQTNKIKYMAPYVSLIHGVDSFKLLAEIDKQARKTGRIIPCLLQIHIAQEETKFGFSTDECKAMLEEGLWRSLNNIRIAGVMGMATNTDDQEQVEREFQTLSDFFQEIKEKHFKHTPEFKEISMGMSDDYPLAIRHGSTLIRVGSRIFGERVY
jgi:pyridoxal phosphate enzyme (YggS family)